MLRFHISIGYETTTAVLTLFEHPTENFQFQPKLDYPFTEEIGTDQQNGKAKKTYFAVLLFDHPVTTLQHTKIIGSNLQIAPNSNECRLAFYGEVVDSAQEKDKATFFSQFKVFKLKKRQGILDRVTNSSAVIVRGLHQKNSNIEHLIGCILELNFRKEDDGTELPSVQGKIESRFGQTDKLRVNLSKDMDEKQMEKCKQKKVDINLVHRKYVFKEEGTNVKKLIQK